MSDLKKLPNLVKVAREHAYLGLYEESLKTFEQALKVIKTHLPKVKDKLLAEEWKKTESELIQEVTEVEGLAEIVLGIKPKRRQQPMEFEEDNMYQQPKQGYQQQQKQKKLPFGKKPFQKNQKKMDIEKPKKKQNYVVKKNNYKKKQDEEKDPDVWSDPDPPKNQKKKPYPRKMNERERRRAYNPPQHKGYGKPNIKKVNRNYDKPWVKKEKKKKKGQKDDEDSFLYHCYPDGNGPDSELIKMLERDVLLKHPKVTFDDIADLDQAKETLQEAVLLPLLMPEFFTGIRRPWKGVLMFGPPGTGETLLAKAIAQTGQTCFFNVHASTLASKWKGESEKLVRILFEMARFYAPSIVFFDEFDSVAAKRGGGSEHESSRKVKSELLVQMDGMPSNDEEEEYDDESKKKKQKSNLVMVLAASNIPWDLDDAIRRRLEKRIYIPLPTQNGRKEMFKIQLKGLEVDPNIDWDKLANMTDMYSGADITSVCREASYMPMRRQLLKSGGLLKDKLKKGENLDQLKKDLNVALTEQDFIDALKNIKQTVNLQGLKKYEDWMKEFGIR